MNVFIFTREAQFLKANPTDVNCMMYNLNSQVEMAQSTNYTSNHKIPENVLQLGLSCNDDFCLQLSHAICYLECVGRDMRKL